MENYPLSPNENTTLPEDVKSVEDLPLTQRLSKRALNTIRLVVLLGVIALTVILVINRERIQEFQALGYPGIFLVSILANATILVPVPGVVFTSAMGAVFNPFWVSIAAGSGAALGELSGYMAGFSGQAVVENAERYDRVVRWMRKYGDITILLLAFFPNPLFDLAGVLAGVLKMPVWKFLFYCLIGKVLKMMMFAYAGGWLMTFLEGIF
jgi:membrane protein YqaA with SNARE-associated domain